MRLRVVDVEAAVHSDHSARRVERAGVVDVVDIMVAVCSRSRLLQVTRPLSSGVRPRLDEIFDGGDNHGQTETADEDVEDAGDVA